MTETIKYRKIRPVKDIINAAFLYFSKNAGSIFFTMLIYTMPLFIISKFISYSLNSSDMNFLNFFSFIGSFKYYRPLPVIVLLLIYFIGITVHNMVLNKHLLINEPLNPGDRVNSSDFKKHLPGDLKLHLPNMFFLGSCASLLGFILVFAVKSLAGEVTFGFVEDPLGFIIQFFPSLIIILAVIPFGGYFFMTSLFVSQRDNTGIFTALLKVWHYSKNNLRRTWTLSVCAIIIAYLCYFCLLFPFRFITGLLIMLEANIYGMSYFLVTNILYTFFALLCLYMFQLMSIYQFASLEEKEEAHYITQKIDQI